MGGGAVSSSKKEECELQDVGSLEEGSQSNRSLLLDMEGRLQDDVVEGAGSSSSRSVPASTASDSTLRGSQSLQRTTSEEARPSRNPLKGLSGECYVHQAMIGIVYVMVFVFEYSGVKCMVDLTKVDVERETVIFLGSCSDGGRQGAGSCFQHAVDVIVIWGSFSSMEQFWQDSFEDDAPAAACR